MKVVSILGVKLAQLATYASVDPATFQRERSHGQRGIAGSEGGLNTDSRLVIGIDGNEIPQIIPSLANGG